jgi:hypothetical protein
MKQEDYNLYQVALQLLQGSMRAQMSDQQQLNQISNKDLSAKALSSKQSLEKDMAKRSKQIEVYQETINKIVKQYFPCDIPEEQTN